MSNENSVYKPDGDLYKYTAEMKFVVDSDDITDIDSINIKYIMADYNYKENNMPMFFVTASLDKKLIDKIVKNQNSAYFILNIKRCISNSDMPDFYVDYINAQFIYFITDDINKTEDADYEGNNSDREDIYKLVNIGLMCLDHINKNKCATVNGIFNKCNLSSLMYMATKHLPILIEKPDDNITFESIFIPPINSTSKLIKYINSIHVLYKTQYRFFIDFDCSYLISSTGKFIKRKGEDIGTILITLKKDYTEESKLQGMTTDESQSMYNIVCDGLDCELADNRYLEKSYSKVSLIDASGNKIDKSINKTEDSLIEDKNKSMRIKNDNTGVIDNIINSANTSAVQILIQKTDVDSSVLTMNKEYIIHADEVYGNTYNGKYILIRKREMYVRENNNFTMNTMLLFEKLPDNLIDQNQIEAKKIH